MLSSRAFPKGTDRANRSTERSLRELFCLDWVHAANPVRGHGLLHRPYAGRDRGALVAADPAGHLRGHQPLRADPAGPRHLPQGAHRAAQVAGGERGAGAARLLRAPAPPRVPAHHQGHGTVRPAAGHGPLGGSLAGRGGRATGALPAPRLRPDQPRRAALLGVRPADACRRHRRRTRPRARYTVRAQHVIPRVEVSVERARLSGMVRTMTTALHGRDGELAVLREALSSLRVGAGVVVVVEGTPGIGKSRLLAEAMRMADRMSVRAGLGETDPSEAVVELAPLLRALFDGAVPLLQRSALPVVRGGPEQRYWLIQYLESLLEDAATVGPVLVCLDDLQWADAGTLAALRALPPRLESLPVAWVLAARAIQPGSALNDLVEQLVSR